VRRRLLGEPLDLPRLGTRIGGADPRSEAKPSEGSSGVPRPGA
jgi:hypothetical protein